MAPTTGYAAAIDTNDLIMSYINESTWGTTPTTPAFKNIRLDGEGFSGSKNRMRPQEIDPSGQASAAITVKEEATGSLNFSVSAGTHNDLLAASIGGVFTTPLSYSGTDVEITAANTTDKTATLVAAAGAFTTTNLVVIGQFIKVYAGTATSQRGIARVKTVAATTLTLECVSWVPAITATGAMGTTTIKGSFCRNGTTFNSFTVQKKMASNLFLRYAGSFPSGGTLEVGTGEYLKGSLDFLCKGESSATAEIAGATYTAAPTGTVIDSVQGIGPVWRSNDSGATPGLPALIAGVVQKISLKWTKEGAAGQFGIGSKDALGIRPGKLMVDGSLATYFANLTLFGEYTNETAGSLSFYALDGPPTASTTKGYVLTLCNARIMNPKVTAGGPSQDFMAEFELEGAPDVSSTSLFAGKTIQIDYFA